MRNLNANSKQVRYELITYPTGNVKQFTRMPRSIDPRDILIEIKTKRPINKVLALKDNLLETTPTEYSKGMEAAVLARLKSNKPG